jgi:hypothetical protein
MDIAVSVATLAVVAVAI